MDSATGPLQRAGGGSSAATLCSVSQPVNNQQAMVRRESVVNLENFKKQYVRRRWKVSGCRGWGHIGSVPMLGPLVLGGELVQQRRATSGLCTLVLISVLLLFKLSFSIVSLCNHLTRSLMKKVHLRPSEDLVCKIGSLLGHKSGVVWRLARGLVGCSSLGLFCSVLHSDSQKLSVERHWRGL